MERQEICSSEMGYQTILRWRSNDSFFHVRGEPNEEGSVWALDICQITTLSILLQGRRDPGEIARCRALRRKYCFAELEVEEEVSLRHDKVGKQSTFIICFVYSFR